MHNRIVVKAIGGFHRIGEWDVDVPIQNCSGCRGLLVGDPEDAGIVTEVGGHVSEESGKFTADLVVRVLDVEIWTVHEDIFLDGVTMQVEVDAESLFVEFLQLFDEL